MGLYSYLFYLFFMIISVSTKTLRFEPSGKASRQQGLQADTKQTGNHFPGPRPLSISSRLYGQGNSEPKEIWNYVNVHPHAHMFWWLYYTTSPATFKGKPLVMWLQGGPGGSSTGFGNFEEIGPLDVNLNPRNTTWLQEASLLFVDNPVGTGYSYVTDDSAYTTDVTMIAKDLVTLFTQFLKEVPDFQEIPFYIFSESYGGKMTAAFSQALYQQIQHGNLKCDFKGFAMGDSWISPIDSVLTWGPYLHSTSLVDKEGLAKIAASAEACQAALKAGQYKNATELWSKTEDAVESTTNGVNFYNILKWTSEEERLHAQKLSSIDKLHHHHVAPLHRNSLAQLMNGPVREKLGIIPKNVTWGAQSGSVFKYQSTDFMKPVVDIVDNMLENSTLQVVVYSGQLDLICDTPGTEIWVQKLKWTGLPGYNGAKRHAVTAKGTRETVAFYKQYKNFTFCWILKAGHMVPADAGETALEMLRMVTQPK